MWPAINDHITIEITRASCDMLLLSLRRTNSWAYYYETTAILVGLNSKNLVYDLFSNTHTLWFSVAYVIKLLNTCPIFLLCLFHVSSVHICSVPCYMSVAVLSFICVRLSHFNMLLTYLLSYLKIIQLRYNWHADSLFLQFSLVVLLYLRVQL